MNKLSPIVSEFETEEEAEAYDKWFRAKVEASLADPRPGIPHDEAMAGLDAIIATKRAAATSSEFPNRLRSSQSERSIGPMNELSPIVSEFETVEQEESYLRWLEAKVAASRADPRPSVPHDEAMARVRRTLEEKFGKPC